MPSTFNFRYAAGALCAVCLSLAPALAHAQAFTVTFAPDTQTIFPGQTTTFSGTIKNATSSDLYVYIDAVDSGDPGLVTDDTPFYNTFGGTPVLLGAGQTSALTDLFTVTDVAAPQGTFQGQYAVYGGSTATSSDQIGFHTFTLDSPVPEASTSLSFALLLAAGAAVFAVKHRRVSRSGSSL